MEFKKSVSIALLLLIGIAQCIPGNEDLIAEESTNIENKAFVVLENEPSQEIKKQSNNQSQIRTNKYSSRIESKYNPVTETQYGFRTYSISKSNSIRNNLVNTKEKDEVKSNTESVLDFRIGQDSDLNKENEVGFEGRGKQETKNDMKMESSLTRKEKKEINKKEDDDEEKTLAQQVADGKYGLIQNEIFHNGSKRPGILSYLPNAEVPKDTKENLGGLEKDEIWLAEDHVLVLKGGRYAEDTENETPNTSIWPPIDNYEAPPRQVKIPENPKIPPPFPIQLSEDGPLQVIKGEDGKSPQPPFLPPFPSFGFPLNESIHFPPPFPVLPDGFPNQSFPFPLPPGPIPPFINNFPPGTAFLPPPGNITDFDEDDPSIYYPPKYDFYYPQDNSTVVPPGPLVPGIILPPPPNFFAPLNNKTKDEQIEEENEAEDNYIPTTETPYVAPGYLPVTRKPTSKNRVYTKRPSKRPTTTPKSVNLNAIQPESTPYPYPGVSKPTVTYVYPENVKKKQTTAIPFDSLRTTKISSISKTPEENSIEGFTSPIYVPNKNDRPVYHPLPTTSPKPNHITIPTSKTLSKEIYIVAKPEYEEKNRIEDIYKDPKIVKIQKYENLRPEIHPLRSLIRPNVSVSYIGKYGHLPAATPFPFPKQPAGEERKPIRGEHFITKAPDIKETALTTPASDINSVTITPITVINKIRVRPALSEQPEVVTTSEKPSKATFYFYEEPAVTDNLLEIVKTTQASLEVSTKKPLTFTNDNNKKNGDQSPVQYHSTLTTNKTPIRQYLEETFHSSNVLQNKPPISHLNGPDIPNQGIYSPDIPKMKHLNYGTLIPQKPVIKYHYVTESNTVAIPEHKIKALEIENSGSTGLQNVNPEKIVLTTTARPLGLFTAVYKPEKQNLVTLNHNPTTPNSISYKNTDGPFVPSNYYATARPDDIHFTPQDHSLVDDITKNYFTIFGQKINSVSTTPLAPITPAKVTSPPSVKNPSSGLSYVTDNGNKYHIQQVHTTRKPILQNSFSYYNEKPKFVQVVNAPSRTQSHFEQYLKELTGEDQKDFIIGGILPTKTKKGKGFVSSPGSVYNSMSQQLQTPLHPPISIYINPYRQQGLSQFLEEQTPVPPLKSAYAPQKYPLRYNNRPKLQYRPSYSTTLRPVMDVEIQPQFVQHLSSTIRPFETHAHSIIPEKFRINHNFGQYLQEISSFTSPTTVNPVKIKNPSSLDYYQTTTIPSNQVSYPQSQYSGSPPAEAKPKPISLEGDILVNYKPPRPEVNPNAEIIDPQNPAAHSFDTNSNFKVVEPPDLSGKNNRFPYRSSYKANPTNYESTKDFFENLPNSGYFAQPHQASGNSFISYNLPGNGGHFYFLTPQIADKVSDDDEKQSRRDQESFNKQRIRLESRYPSQIEHSGNDHTNQDYLRRRRRKKP